MKLTIEKGTWFKKLNDDKSGNPEMPPNEIAKHGKVEINDPNFCFVVNLKAKKIIIGKSKKADIIIDESNSSDKHALIKKSWYSYYIEDLGNVQGTFVNEKRIISAQKLKKGDLIRIGKTVLKVIR